MSNGSKILYGLLLDRVDLSVRNKWMRGGESMSSIHWRALCRR
ncbi:hypothetical protein ACTQ28_03220 [Bacillota bacterium LCP21S3_A4]